MSEQGAPDPDPDPDPDEIVVEVRDRRSGPERVVMRLGEGSGQTAPMRPHQATPLAGRLVRAAHQVVPRLGRLGSLDAREFSTFVQLLRRFAETDMDQWEMWSITTTYGPVQLGLVRGDPDPAICADLDGFLAPVERVPAPPATGPADDGWHFTLAAERIEQLQLDQRVGLLVSDGTQIVIESPFRLTIDGTTVEVTPHDGATVAPVLRLLRRTTSSLHLTRAGTLVLELHDGGRLDVAADLPAA